MTNTDAVTAVIEVPGASALAIAKVLQDAGLNATDSYVSANAQMIDMAALTVLQGMLAVNMVKEGGYELQYSTVGIQKRINYIQTTYNLLPNKIRAVCMW